MLRALKDLEEEEGLSFDISYSRGPFFLMGDQEQINADRTSVYNIAALCLNDLESRQQLLACSSAAEALDELKTHVFGLVNEEE